MQAGMPEYVYLSLEGAKLTNNTSVGIDTILHELVYLGALYAVN